MKEKWIFLTVAAVAVSLLAGGCNSRMDSGDDASRRPAPRDRDMRLDVAGTVGQYARIQDGGYMPVKGYGLVVGLGKNGASEVPPHLREYLIKDLLRNGVGLHTMGTGGLSPGRILADLDTAVVMVEALIPPRALADDHFDVVVTAHSATGTRSLDGGILMPTDLRLDIGTEADPEAGSKVWAVAARPLMLNPYAPESDDETRRRGRVVGGGELTRNRRVSLMMIRADYQLADLIQRRINSRFPSSKRVANAKNREVIELFVPPDYYGDQVHFLQLVSHLPLNNGPGAWEARARSLVAEMAKPDARHEGLALALEAQGGQVIPMIRPLYDSDLPGAAFFAARTGMRLGDSKANPVVLDFAQKAGGPYRVPAIEALGRHAGMPRADLTLRKLLDDDDNLVRIAAYEALCGRGNRAVVQLDIDGRFGVDVVRSEKHMIYATRTEQARIVIFGTDVEVGNPVFFNAFDDLVTINANEGSEELTVWRKIPQTGGVSDKFHIPFDAVSLIKTLGSRAEYGPDGEIAGLGLTYGQVVSVLYRMCEKGSMNARFVLQALPGERQMLRAVEDVAAKNIEPEANSHMLGAGQ